MLTDTYAHLLGKRWKYRNPSPNTASTRFFVRDGVVYTDNARGIQRAVMCETPEELERHLDKLLIEAND